MNPAHAQPKVNLTISGELTESQQRNIRNFLSLSRLQDNAPLSLPVLNRLYGKAEQEAATALEPFGSPPRITLSKQQKTARGRFEVG